MHWLALSDGGRGTGRDHALIRGPVSALMHTGAFVVELGLAGPPAEPLTILDHASDLGWARALRLVLHPDGRLRLTQQQGAGRAEVELQLPLSHELRGLRITYGWNAPERRSRLTVELLPDGQVLGVAGCNPLPLPAEDVTALFGSNAARFRHPAVAWMGLSTDEKVPSLGAAVSAATPIRTPSGFVRADNLRAEDVVMTRDHGPRPLRWVCASQLPAQGSFVPVRLRAPFFASGQDLVVAPDQRIAMSGAEVEYLFGEEEVLVPARHLVNGRSAFYEVRRPLVSYVSLLFDEHEVILAADCAIESLYLDSRAAAALPDAARPVTGPAARRSLRDYEAVTLRNMREQIGNPTAA